MKLKLVREDKNDKCTIGKLYVDGEFCCYTLEDVVREKPGVPVEKWKVPGETAIPVGTYNITVNMSPRFGKLLPRLGNVPGFMGVLIHKGNAAKDTEGCILVGMRKAPFSILDSGVAFDLLFPKIKKAVDSKETVTIEVT